MSKARQSYIKEQILSASPEELLILMYDSAIRSLEDAKKMTDAYEFNQRLIKAQNIIAELMGALKKEKAPEVVTNLAKLYEFIYRQLVDANLNRDVLRVDRVLGLLRNLRDSWQQAIEKAEHEKKAARGSEIEVPVKAATRRPGFALEA